MPTPHGTATYTLGQYNEVHAAVTRALPKALEGTQPQELIPAVLKQGEALEQALSRVFRSMLNSAPEAASPPVFPAIPIEGTRFELARSSDPIEMVRSDGVKYKLEHLTPPRRFKLVRAGKCRNLDEVRQKLTQHGEIPEGEWLEAFKATYPKLDDGPIGIADPSWVSPYGAFFSCVGTSDGTCFHRADDVLIDSWRWLVEVK